ncbi:MAG: ATP-binding protein, partial [Bacilli bacterium]|nr:ATP-binding protein [Bacilli bacterium]MDD2682482.1 ATP-binding protein [Bacilli bacterium]MDD3085089.1 ATP-binding protein [Candidatus ainarchaeum sp.]
RNTGGTGLGLSIVKHITQIYNGNIMLSSTLGKGTSIKIIFSK